MRTLFFALLALSFQVGYAQTNGLVAHWNFNGTVNDASGNGHNGLAHNISYIHTPWGAINDSSAVFQGSTSSYVSIPHDTMLNLEKHTLTASLRIDEFYTGLCQLNFIYMKGEPYKSGTWGLAFFDNAYDSSCTVTNDTNNFVMYGEAGRNNISIPQAHWQTTNTLRTSTWYCVVSTWDGQERKTYINGNLVSTAFPSQSPVSIGTNNDSLIIGCNRKGNFQTFPYWFKGAINDIKIYNRVLTSVEIINGCTADTSVYLKQPFSKYTLCSDDTINVSYGTTDTFKTGNVFTAQLSDATGSFTTPVNIGSLASTIDGTITCTIPTGLTPGSNYRIRIVASSPAKISDVSNPLTVVQPNQTASVSITASPSGPVPQNNPITFLATPVNAGASPTYQWFRNNQPVPGATTNFWISNNLNDGDTIHVVLQTNSQCLSEQSVNSNEIIVQITSSISDLKVENLKLYPNPNSGTFLLSGADVKNEYLNLEIINAIGQSVFTNIIQTHKGQFNTNIQLDNFSKGVYMVTLTSPDGRRITRNMIIE